MSDDEPRDAPREQGTSGDAVDATGTDDSAGGAPVLGESGGPRLTARDEDGGLGVRKTARAEDGQSAIVPAVLSDVQVGEVICGEYTVVSVLRRHAVDRAGLYHCRDREGRDVLIKVAPPAHRPDRDLWEQLQSLRHPNVIETRWVLEYEDLFYDVQEYCSGGSLADRAPAESDVCSSERCEWLMEAVVPQLLAGIGYLHDRGLAHRDVKPANIYIRETDNGEDYVLADLDVSQRLGADGRTTIVSNVAFTDEFAAPEAFPVYDPVTRTTTAAVTPKMDYYSLGMTLYWLLCGCTFLTGARTAQTWYMSGGQLTLPGSIPERLETLLRGLLVRRYSERWGAEETLRWVRGETTADDLALIEADRAAHHRRSARSYKLGELSASDLPELARAMQTKMYEAKQGLLGNDFIVNWIANIDSNVGLDASADREAYRDFPGVAVFAVGMLCDSTLPLHLEDGSVIESLQALVQVAQAALEAGDEGEMARDENLLRIELWFRRRDPADPVIADGVAAVRGRGVAARVRLAELLWRLEPTRPLRIVEGIEAKTPEQVARLAYGYDHDWASGTPECYSKTLQLYRDGLLAAWLRARELDDVATEVTSRLESAAGQETVAFETTLRVLDKGLGSVRVRIDPKDVKHAFRVSFGQEGSKAFAYETVGPGIPAGALLLEGALPGLQIAPPAEIVGREGCVSLRLDSRNDIPVARTHAATLKLDSGYAQLVDTPVEVRYRVSYPALRTVWYVLVGAILGAVVVGGPRLLMSYLGVSGVVGIDPPWESVVPPTDPDYYVLWLRAAGDVGIWDRVQWGEYPFWELIVGLVVFAVALAVGWRLLRWSLRHKAEG